MTKKDDAKRNMLAHSQAKVEFFEAYLQRYLRVLYRTPYVTAINIYDIFCGTGIYENGKKGSPIVTFEAIKRLHSENTTSMKIRLIINDGEPLYVEGVKALIDAQNEGYCEVSYHTLDASLMFETVINEVTRTANNARNLIFIDPYGYKEINRETILRLLSNKRTEIILFLPVSHMQRFTQKALESNDSQFEPLKRFVNSFFDDYHPIYDEKKTVHEYINYLKYALRFNCHAFYSTSYSIQRDLSSFYALFFMTSHMYGYEKILDVKWELDEIRGSGFLQPKIQQSLFEDEDKKVQQEANYKRLEDLLRKYLQKPRTNNDVYAYVLHFEFLPKHANKVFSDWQQKSGNFEVTDFDSGVPARKGSFYISWEHCKPQAKPKVRLYLKN